MWYPSPYEQQQGNLSSPIVRALLIISSSHSRCTHWAGLNMTVCCLLACLSDLGLISRLAENEWVELVGKKFSHFPSHVKILRKWGNFRRHLSTYFPSLAAINLHLPSSHAAQQSSVASQPQLLLKCFFIYYVSKKADSVSSQVLTSPNNPLTREVPSKKVLIYK